MTVALLPPVSSSGMEWRGELPLTEAPRYLRGPGNSRWHRARSGEVWPDGRTIINYWCGPSHQWRSEHEVWQRDDIPNDDAMCGTCWGRAVGAKQDQAPTGLPRLRFDPRWLQPPSKCPGSSSRTLWTEVENGFNVGQCLACGDYVTVRCVGKGYDAWGSGPVIHPPGKALFEPCPFHAWQRAALVDDVVRCGCGWPPGGPQ